MFWWSFAKSLSSPSLLLSIILKSKCQTQVNATPPHTPLLCNFTFTDPQLRGEKIFNQISWLYFKPIVPKSKWALITLQLPLWVNFPIIETIITASFHYFLLFPDLRELTQIILYWIQTTVMFWVFLFISHWTWKNYTFNLIYMFLSYLIS